MTALVVFDSISSIGTEALLKQAQWKAIHVSVDKTARSGAVID